MSKLLRVSSYQMDIVWEDKQSNLAKIEKIAGQLSGKTDMIILPEMFSTGFSMHPELLAEDNDGETISRLKKLARECDLTFVGSFIASENGCFYNRGFFITTESCYFADKRHLFRMGEESKHYSAGDKRLVVNYKDFNIALFICYDLRFPVWSSNYGNAYDLAIYVASWPKPRRKAWTTLLEARAIENSCYVCGVNRCGTDGLGLVYTGDTRNISPKGEVLSQATESQEEVVTYEYDLSQLQEYRKKFPVWKDMDNFMLTDI
ncbi:MAG: amidohydrolase [Bacteroidales bacterium]